MYYPLGQVWPNKWLTSFFVLCVFAGWAMIWRGLSVMWTRGCCAVCVEMCCSAPSRLPVSTPTAAPASVVGWSTTTPVLKTDWRWTWPLWNHCTGLSFSVRCSISLCSFFVAAHRDHRGWILISMMPSLSVFGLRYMRNDLSRLQIRCVNAAQGCEVVCSLENLHTHEDECQFAFISCSNTGATAHTDWIIAQVYLLKFCIVICPCEVIHVNVCDTKVTWHLAGWGLTCGPLLSWQPAGYFNYQTGS